MFEAFQALRRRSKAVCMAAFIADGWTLADNLEKTIDRWTEGWMDKLKSGSRACDRVSATKKPRRSGFVSNSNTREKQACMLFCISLPSLPPPPGREGIRSEDLKIGKVIYGKKKIRNKKCFILMAVKMTFDCNHTKLYMNKPKKKKITTLLLHECMGDF